MHYTFWGQHSLNAANLYFTTQSFHSLDALFWVTLPPEARWVVTEDHHLDHGIETLELPPQGDLSVSIHHYLSSASEASLSFVWNFLTKFFPVFYVCTYFKHGFYFLISEML